MLAVCHAARSCLVLEILNSVRFRAPLHWHPVRVRAQSLSTHPPASDASRYCACCPWTAHDAAAHTGAALRGRLAFQHGPLPRHMRSQALRVICYTSLFEQLQGSLKDPELLPCGYLTSCYPDYRSAPQWLRQACCRGCYAIRTLEPLVMPILRSKHVHTYTHRYMHSGVRLVEA